MTTTTTTTTTQPFLVRGNHSHLRLYSSMRFDQTTIRVKNRTNSTVYFMLAQFKNSRIETSLEGEHVPELAAGRYIDLVVRGRARIPRSKRHRVTPFLPRKGGVDNARSPRSLGRRNVAKLRGGLLVFFSWPPRSLDSAGSDVKETLTLYAHLPKEASAAKTAIQLFVSSARVPGST